MRDQHHRGSGRRENVLQLVAHEKRHLVVERGERFVEKQHLRVHRQRTHDRHQLLLPARQFVREAVQVEADVEGLHQFIGARVAFTLRLAGNLERVLDIVDRALPGKQCIAVVLEYVADHRLRQGLAVEQRFARIHRQQARHHVDHGRLAAAVGPEDRGDLPFGQIEVEVGVQRLPGEALGQAADGDVRIGGRATRRSGRQGFRRAHGMALICRPNE